MKTLILIAVMALTTNIYAYDNLKVNFNPLTDEATTCNIDKLDYCLENSDSDGCYELSSCEEQPNDRNEYAMEESTAKVCLQLYMPVECENRDGHLEIFSNECEANKRGYTHECRFTEQL